MRFIIAAIATLVAFPAIADECIKIEEPLDRLACYDKASGVTPEVKEVEGKGEWKVRTETSKIDDTTNVYLSLKSDTATSCRYDSKIHTLQIACRENTTSLWVHFGGCFMSDNSGGGKVTYRLDSDKASTVNMGESNSNSALGLWSGGSSIPFVRKMLGKSTLLLRATPFSDSQVTAEYDIRGLREAAKPLMEACGWGAQASTSAKKKAAERRLQAGLELARKMAEERAQDWEAREQAERRKQLAELDAGAAPEARANEVLSNTPLDRIFAAADAAADVSDGSAFSEQTAGGAALTPGETQAALDQLRRCWRVDALTSSKSGVVPVYHAQLRQNGFVDQGSVTLISPSPIPLGSEAVVGAARKALQDLRCQPFAFPPQKYNAWRDIVIRFDPAQMVLQ